MRHSFIPYRITSLTFTALLSAAFFWNASVSAGAQPTKGLPTQVHLGTATKGGGFQLFGQNLIEVINATDASLQVKEMPTRGSNQNLPLLEQGKIDIGLVEGNAARQALDGVGRPVAKLKVLTVMYPNPGMFVVRADSHYKRIDDLKGKPIAIGTRASGLRILGNDVLSGIGLNAARDFQQVILNKAAEGPRFVLEKKVEALWGAGIGWPGFVKVANSATGAHFIPPSTDEIKLILAKHPHLKKMSIPAGTYKGQQTQIDSIGLWSLILVRPDLDEDTVYRITRAIHQGSTMLIERLKQGSYTTMENTVAQVPATRLHPGAARYFRELGLMN